MKHNLIRCILPLLLAGLVLPLAGADTVTDAKRKAAEGLAREGKNDAALTLYEEIIKDNSATYADFLSVARLYEKTGQTAAAITAYKTVKDLIGRPRLNAERQAFSEAEKRLEELDAISRKLDKLLADLRGQLEQLEKEALAARNEDAVQRIRRLKSAIVPGWAEFDLDATKDWQSSGVTIEEGKRYRVSASGRYESGPGTVLGPEGTSPPKLTAGYPHGAVIASIDKASPYLVVGQEASFVARGSGTLFLKINDGDYSNNKGKLRIVIEAQ